MKLTNQSNIPLPLAVFLATDDYDYVPNTISATSLLKPIRQLVLTQRLQAEDNLIDIADLVSSRMGSAIHTAIEQAWKNPTKALKALGYPEKVIDKIKVNPSDNELDKGIIAVYQEQRSYKELMGFTVSGKYDFVAEGIVQDFKSTSVYTYLNQTNTEKYQLQGSIYRWLNPDKITKDYMYIHFIFTDWNKVESLKNKSYPSNRVQTQKINLLSLDETEQFIKSKLTLLKRYKETTEQEIPLCSDDDLWRKPTVYKYFKNPDSTRSTKNFDSLSEATKYMVEQGSVGVIKEVKGTVSACKYCPAFALCTQKDGLIQNGDLVI